MIAIAIPQSGGAEVLVQLFAMAFMGAICAAVAHGRGRSPVGWFFVGCFFTCFGLILVLVLPDLKAAAQEKERLELANRQLREQLAKDRAVADARQELTDRRLSAHDQVLQIDTTANGSSPVALPPPVPPRHNWYYADGAERVGPLELEDMLHLLRMGRLRHDTLVWREGFEGWKPLASVPEISGGAA
ncbi:MAG: hypothetical protein RL112_469 [Planctomycetota bacterium]|jgi:hypothetical protein